MLIATTAPARTPRLAKLTSSTITIASKQRVRELPDGFFDHHRLIGDQVGVDTDGHVRLDALHRGVQALAQLEDVSALRHRDAEPDRGLRR